MQLSFWEKIVEAFKYNDVLWHDIYLTIIYALLAIVALLLLKSFIRSIKLRSDPEFKKRMARPRPLRAILTGLGGAAGFLIIPMGIFLVLSIQLGNVSSASANNQLILYEQQSKPLAVSIVEKFQANSSGQYGTTGSTHTYLEAVDLNRGELAWKTRLQRGGSRNNFILGLTEDQIIVFNGEGITLVTKANGKIIADQDSLADNSPVLKGQFSEDPTWYKWEDKSQTIRFKGADGQVYEIDPAHQTGKLLEGVKASAYFQQDSADQSPNGDNQTLLLIKSGAKDGRYMTFLGDEEIEAMQQQAAIESNVSERRKLYIGSLQRKGKAYTDDLKPVSDQVFIKGAFLADDKEDASSPYLFVSPPDFKSLVKEPVAPQSKDYSNVPAYFDALDAYHETADAYGKQEQSYKELFRYLQNRYGSVVNRPPLTVGKTGVLLVIHQSSTLPDSHFLLSAVDTASGKVQWTADTGMQMLGQYKVQKGSLVMMGMAQGSSITDLLTLSLSDGLIKGFNYKYEKSYTRSPL
ncbi:PA2928 family protein [Paenibacillus sp. CAA11]|uniref:PA2928 family protein n=1 Tax=Paenibacillus sp. CAA11 TaxID=1532905 RepID=UPI001F36252B|nr:PA2928 family protein [Paenibacillus sp. CAA11]